MKNIVIFCSGNGSNFISIYKATKDKQINGKIVLLVSDKKKCGAVSFAIENRIDVHVERVDDVRTLAIDGQNLLDILIQHRADLLLLAGYLKLIPINVVDYFKNRMLNIHPSLLPKFGGKGFYGKRVHKAVIESNETQSGITIHFVNEKYDDGSILFQKKISIKGQRNALDLSKMILKIEHHYFPKVIALFCLDKIKWKSNKPELIQEKDFEYEVCNN
ncbi:MAG: hypothetical protein CBD58_04640 [bacterium TMED198]|nr:MAG: hypothetical protein CBD58_04640 [bacterium TMED198]|tara:strand:+ start:453 stop:1106 length:654 start_codon:yes stop_codon:yes gene_type:complete